MWNLERMTEIAISEAGSQLDELVRRAADGETIALTDAGRVAALLVSPEVIADLEDSLAVADHQRRKAEGTSGRASRTRRSGGCWASALGHRLQELQPVPHRVVGVEAPVSRQVAVPGDRRPTGGEPFGVRLDADDP